MRAIVCIKQVPDTSEVRIDPERGTLIREGVPTIVNPFDTYAIEEALRLREQYGGQVTAITMGPPQAREALREAIAMGCDDAILLSDRAFAGSDTWATAYTLAQAIRQLGHFDLIFCGKQAIDGDTGQVGPGVARQLEITQLTYVCKIQQIDFSSGNLRVERLLEEGREVVESRLPALIAVVKDINQPRYPSFKGIRRASRTEIPVWGVDKLVGSKFELFGLDGSPTRVMRVFNPPPRGGHIEIIKAATPAETAETLAERLIHEKIF